MIAYREGKIKQGCGDNRSREERKANLTSRPPLQMAAEYSRARGW